MVVHEFGTRKGPKTVVVMFAYGGVHPSTVTALAEDIGKSGYVSGRAERSNETLKAQGMPELAADWPVRFTIAPQDALVSRSRSAMAQRFLEGGDDEVLIMLDHDLWWMPPSETYEGDLLHIARQCANVKGIVGAAVSKKVRGQGIASMAKREGDFIFGCESNLEPMWYLGAAFTAYHRNVIEAVSKEGYLYGKHVSETRMPQCVPGFKPIFMEMVVPHPMDPKINLHLSEDWALCHRARELGFETYMSCRPLVVHYGEYGFQVVRDAQIVESNAVATEGKPAISLLHATRGRPQLASAAVTEWISRADDKSRLEYLVSVDDDDEAMAGWKSPDLGLPVTVLTGPSRGNVDAYNRAYAKSTGSVLVQVHDDVVPPQGWDTKILERIGDATKPVALMTDDDIPEGVNNNPDLMTVAIVTREFAKRLGGLFYPDYVSVYCDNDLSGFAKQHGYVVEAKDLKFKHAWNGADRDDTQKRSYAPKNWEMGKAIYNRRMTDGFPEVAG